MSTSAVKTRSKVESAATDSAAFLKDALAGLTAAEKSLDPKWLYDSVGSALFEEITNLPEYYLTRTETAILRENALDLAGLVPHGGALIEFGSGASVKTRLLLDAGPHFGSYVPVDISADFLQETAMDLRRRYPDLAIEPVVGDFLNPVALPPHLSDARKVGFFPGSTLGNIDPAAARGLLSRARDWPGVESFVLGVDLVKEARTLELAYDDAQGVTAKFIINILERMNRDLGARFDPANFQYQAKWNAGLAQIEMSLVSRSAQRVMLGGQQIRFGLGEMVKISQSRKFTRASLARMAADSSWRVDRWITDPDETYAVVVLAAA